MSFITQDGKPVADTMKKQFIGLVFEKHPTTAFIYMVNRIGF